MNHFPRLAGLHHVTAVTAQARANHRFYTQLLGLRLVKKTVNQDDVSAYHLFYADGEATPGTDLTFFVWPLGPERRGTRSVIRTGLRVGSEASLRWWAERFQAAGVTHIAPVERDGRWTIDFEDPEGQRFSMINDGGVGTSHPWAESPVPAEHQIRGLGPALLSVPELAPTVRTLEVIMGLHRVRHYFLQSTEVDVFEMGEGGPAGEVHLVVDPGQTAARSGAGGVHHLAFRAPGDEDYEQWSARLGEFRIPSSGPVDRYYFRSLYFREPNGILFEIATDGPGFATDEPLDQLGKSLSLPPFLESRRREIEARLEPLED